MGLFDRAGVRGASWPGCAQFVRDEIFPLETLDLGYDDHARGHQAPPGGGQGARACGPPTCPPSSGAAGSARSSWV